eukprot:TRINITY_DN20480_c0_g1_i1.p1 TRINITY_DN20480_c0_g1~~TRINITY_DN20480_c0_g1_i1.p1  ORF type:complete len:132 (-),score=31.68 TRINITY_DN20480_c0_g1_i1:78-473(-)
MVEGRSNFSWSVKCRSMPDFLSDENITPPYFFKVDVEGFEHELLAAWAGWLPSLAALPTIFLSVHPRADAAVGSGFAAVAALYRHVLRADERGVLRPAARRHPCAPCDYLFADRLPPVADRFVRIVDENES